jgi:hypothetical protein
VGYVEQGGGGRRDGKRGKNKRKKKSGEELGMVGEMKGGVVE